MSANDVAWRNLARARCRYQRGAAGGGRSQALVGNLPDANDELLERASIP
jgi:hypothetical protein